MRQYVVQKGDTLRRVVARYSLAYEQLITANPCGSDRISSRGKCSIFLHRAPKVCHPGT